jgi:hypothetical protein
MPFHIAASSHARWPIVWVGDIAVFDRIAMDVVDVAFKVLVAANRMFPEPLLPNLTLAFALGSLFRFWKTARKSCLQERETCRKIRVVVGKECAEGDPLPDPPLSKGRENESDPEQTPSSIQRGSAQGRCPRRKVALH